MANTCSGSPSLNSASFMRRKCRLREYNWLSFCEIFLEAKSEYSHTEKLDRRMATAQSSDRKAAVIGSGFGGLGAAIRLQSAGIQTVLYEARDLPGGRAYVYHDDGFTFDAGPTVITAPHTLTDLFELTDRRLEDYIRLIEVTPMYRLIWSDGDRFDYVRDEATMVEQIRSRSPRDAEGYQKFFQYAKKVFDKGYTASQTAPSFVSRTCLRCLLPDAFAGRSLRLQHRGEVRQGRPLEAGVEFPFLLVGGNPFQTSSITR